ncbi:YdcF family protein [Caenispirillum bisanense]|uniref:YdcF family protein n=1 Tax=Caenispirillum bisanense TaxID=414052 RepID=UPI0031DB3C5A
MSIEEAALPEVSPAPPRAPRKAADCLVILGAKLTSEGAPTPALQRRVEHAAGLWRQGVAPALMVCGGATGAASASASGVSEAAVMARLLTAGHGVPPTALVMEDVSQDTLGNAREALALAAARNWRRLVVVTDAVHLPRALWTFRRLAQPLGISVDGQAAPAPPRLSPAWWLYSLREAAASLVYLVRVRAPRR